MTTLTWNDLPKPGSSDHKWTGIYNQFVQAGDVQGYLNYLQTQRPDILAQWQTTHPGTGTGGSGGTGGTGGTGTGGGAVPISAPTPIMAPAISYSGRFGTYSDPAYQVGTSYAGPETVPGVPTPTAMPPAGTGSIAGVPQGPAGIPGTPGASGGVPPAGGAPGAPSTRFPTNPGAGGGLLSSGGGGNSGFGRGGLLSTGQGGNVGAVQGSGANSSAQGRVSPSAAGGGGSFWDNFHGDAYGTGGMVDAAERGPYAYNSMNPLLNYALTAAGYIPGPVGTGIGLLGGLAKAGMRLDNADNTDAIRASLGGPYMTPLQVAGAALGWNDYGALDGSRRIFDREDFHDVNGHPLGVSTGGDIHDPGWIARTFFGAVPSTDMTPEEARLRQIAAKTYGTAGGGSGNVGDRGGSLNSPGGASGTNSYGTGGAYANRSGAVGGVSTAMGDHVRAELGQGSPSGGGSDGGGRFDSHGNVAGAGGNASAWGGTGEKLARGGYVPGKPDKIVDNRPVMADEGEFVVKRSAAKAAGKGLLRSLNTPAGAKKMRGLLRSA